MSNILKRLRRLLRRYRGLALLGSVLLAVSVIGLSFYLINSKETGPQEQMALEVMVQQPSKLLLVTNYLCGTETEIKHFNSLKDIEAWIKAQEVKWTITHKNDKEITLTREVSNDLSPMCKNEGYFGVSKDGMLTLFQGPPTENQVIQTFFRIDTELLESKLPKEEITFLKSGIKIHNVAEYLSILSTFGEFAVEY